MQFYNSITTDCEFLYFSILVCIDIFTFLLFSLLNKCVFYLIVILIFTLLLQILFRIFLCIYSPLCIFFGEESLFISLPLFFKLRYLFFWNSFLTSQPPISPQSIQKDFFFFFLGILTESCHSLS